MQRWADAVARGYMFLDDPETESISTAAVPQLETRHSMARNAIVNGHEDARKSLQAFLDAFSVHLAEFSIDRATTNTLDVTILRALAGMKPGRDNFLDLFHVSLQHPDSAQLLGLFRSALGHTISLKQAPRDVIHFNHLWCDHYRFFTRELFLYCIAILIRAARYEGVAELLCGEYSYSAPGGLQQGNFLKFDAYIKSLDEFRRRRLRLNRISVASDLLRERSDLPFISFDDMMQADFLLCVHGLLHHPGALTRWFPRTLVYAQTYEKTGFDFFVRVQAGGDLAPLATVFQVRDLAEFLDRFEQVRRQCRLDEWAFGGCPIPFDGYLNLKGLATV